MGNHRIIDLSREYRAAAVADARECLAEGRREDALDTLTDHMHEVDALVVRERLEAGRPVDDLI